VRLSITANWSGWSSRSAAQLGFSGFLWVAQPLGEPEALIEKELGADLGVIQMLRATITILIKHRSNPVSAHPHPPGDDASQWIQHGAEQPERRSPQSVEPRHMMVCLEAINWAYDATLIS